MKLFVLYFDLLGPDLGVPILAAAFGLFLASISFGLCRLLDRLFK